MKKIPVRKNLEYLRFPTQEPRSAPGAAFTLNAISPAFTYTLLPPNLPLHSNGTGGAQEGYGEKSSQRSQRD